MDKNILEKKIAEGLSSYQIATKLNKSQTAVRYWLKKFDLKTHHATPAKHLCLVCGETSSNSFYSRQKSKCKKCHNQDEANRGRLKRKKAIKHLGGKCSKCSYDKCTAALEFHHIDPFIKDPNFDSFRGWGFDRMKKELKNCVLLCANCHREEHVNIHATIDK